MADTKSELGTRMFALEKALQLNGQMAQAGKLVEDAKTFMEFLEQPKSSIVSIGGQILGRP